MEIRKTDKCLNSEDVVKYLTDSEHRESLKKHVSKCNYCFGLTVIGHSKLYNLKAKGCKKIEPLLQGYYFDRLTNNQAKDVFSHFHVCAGCRQKYEDIVARIESEEHIKDHEITIKEIIMGYITRLKSLLPELAMTQPVPLRAESKKTKQEMEDIDILNKKGVTTTIAEDRGKLKVQIESDLYELSGVKVSLGKKTREGFAEIVSAVTNKKGIADFGKLKKIPPAPSKRGYLLRTSGLKRRINLGKKKSE